ncbi:MAG: hypothetical protein M3Q84_00455 [Actinomycetota bacterium]|nr:hypothetical protein [Actinomycetota bacterium]
MTHVRRLAGVAIVTVLAAALVVAAVIGLRSVGVIGPSERCLAEVDGVTVSLDLEQSRYAALIGAVATARGLPARAITIALATAYQESDLRNVDYGDRDSLGLFQQRPSQGWGTAAEVQDPTYATNAFYDALVQITDYRELPVTEAAQAVQRSAFPGAYADHEADARVLASALSGNSPAAFSCELAVDDLEGEVPLASGLTPRAQRVLDDAQAAFGQQSVGGFDAAGVTSGHMARSAHYDGRAVDVFFASDDPAAVLRGWSLAHWVVANADRLEVATVIYRDQIWTAARSGDGWRPYVPPDGPTDNPTLRHLDHVHVDVVAGA